MNRIDKLRRARSRHAVAWRDFQFGFRKDATRFFCFFEGNDDAKYYGIRIKLLGLSNKPVNLRCQGKEGVLRLLKLVSGNKKYEKAWVAFFIDKDFDEPQELPSDERLYITPGYSIENLYVTPLVFAEILRDEFLVSESEPAFEATLQIYKTRLTEFNDATSELNACHYLQRQREKSHDGSKLNIADRGLKDLVEVKIDRISKRYTLPSLSTHKTFANATDISEAEVAQQVELFSKSSRTARFRGKFLLKFLQLFLVKLKKERVSKNSRYFSDKGKVKLALSGNLISELSQYAETPECLRDFLSRHKI
jgi:hypothetical protein